MDRQEPIRIAQIVGKWLGGGVESILINYYRHVDRSRVQFDFICDADSTNIPYDEINSLGGRVFLVPPYQKVFSYHRELKKLLVKNNYKIVHSHINTLSVFSLFAAKKANIPIRIAHSHSISNNKEFKRNLIKQILRPFSRTFANKYMCCSEKAGRWQFGDKAYDKGEVYMLKNAIELDRFRYDGAIRTKIRKDLSIESDTVVIGHLGRFVETKNHKFLVDIFSELNKLYSNSKLILAGQGPLETEIRDWVRLRNIENCVVFLGQISNANEIYQALDAFVLPSLYEGFPVVGVEAQTAGLICVFSDEMSSEVKLLDTTTFVSLSEPAGKWAEIILSLLKNHERKDTCKILEAHGLNIETEAKKLEQLYLEWQNA